MDVRGVTWGRTSATGYLVFDRKGGEAAVIDAPPGATKRFMEICKENDLTVSLLVNTHGHWEQIAENIELARATSAPLCAHVWDATRMANPSYTMFNSETFTVVPSRADRSIHDGEVLEVGNLRLEVMHTPGHSPGSVCLYEPQRGIIFTGDTLLHGEVGRTDIPGGDQAALRTSLKRLCDLPNSTNVFPAHGRSTTIREERWLLELALLDDASEQAQKTTGRKRQLQK